MSTKHTPGPWEPHEGSAIVGPKIDDKPIWLRPVIARFETPVQSADLALMCAATDLLAALRELAAYAAQEIGLPLDECVAGPIGKARAAIAKAEGA